MELTIIGILYVFVILFDFIPLLKTRQKKVIITYAVILFISLCGMILINVFTNIPSVAEMIRTIVEKVLKRK